MTTHALKIVPFPVPTHVYLEIPGTERTITVAFSELSREALEELCSDFCAAVLNNLAVKDPVLPLSTPVMR